MSMNAPVEDSASETDSELEAPIPQEVRNRVIQQVYRQSGIALDNLTCNFVNTRLRRRLRALGIDKPADYLSFIDANRDEAQQLVSAFTTNETSFFRTKSLWNYLENTLLPELISRKSTAVPYFWSAACSSGEEAYSLAMVSNAAFTDSRSAPRINASDICHEVVRKATDGRYQGRTINRLKASRPEMLNKHFHEHDGYYQISANLRKLVRFSHHNLMQDTGKRDTYDLVLLRNVLIYFEQADQEKIIRNIYQSMKPGGVLAIGEAESLAFCDVDLEYIQPFVYRKSTHG